MKEGPVNWTDVALATKGDSTFRSLLKFVREGWPKAVAADIKPFWNIRDEISTQGDCLLRELRYAT